MGDVNGKLYEMLMVSKIAYSKPIMPDLITSQVAHQTQISILPKLKSYNFFDY